MIILIISSLMINVYEFVTLSFASGVCVFVHDNHLFHLIIYYKVCNTRQGFQHFLPEYALLGLYKTGALNVMKNCY